MPVAAVSAGAAWTASSGSRIVASGTMRSSQNNSFFLAAGSRMPAVGITSLAEPAVVGTAICLIGEGGIGARSIEPLAP
jgi:hypothetical protein